MHTHDYYARARQPLITQLRSVTAPPMALPRKSRPSSLRPQSKTTHYLSACRSLSAEPFCG